MTQNLPPALTDQELEDRLGSKRAEQPIVISGGCHMGAPTVVFFEGESSLLLLVCSACGQPITRIAVAKSTMH